MKYKHNLKYDYAHYMSMIYGYINNNNDNNNLNNIN